MPRLAHSKSRLGCMRCKQRKVKCDEVRPSCRACLRHNVPCDYPKIFVKLRDQYSPVDSTTPPQPSQQQQQQSLEAAADIRPTWSKDPSSTFAPISPTFSQLSDHVLSQHTQTPIQVPPTTSMTSAPYITTPPRVDSVMTSGRSHSPETSSEDEGECNRRFEMRLMHHFTVETSRTFSSYCEGLWGLTAPELGVQHSFLLDEILAISALHLSRKYPDEPDYLEASYSYHQRSVGQHAKAMQNIRPDNFEALIVTTLLMCMHSFALMAQSERHGSLSDPDSHSPVALIASWYHFSDQSGDLFLECQPWTRQSEKLRPIILTADVGADRNIFAEINRAPFVGLLRAYPELENVTLEDQDAYEKTLSYIGLMHHLVSSGRESSLMSKCRMLRMPTKCPRRFTVLVAEQRPRALVMLAHAFAIALMVPCDKWWTQGIFGTQIKIIHDFVPAPWRMLMSWPLEITRTYKE